MAKNGNSKNGKNGRQKETEHRLHPETKNSIWGIVIAGLSIIFFLAGFHRAGPGGEFLYGIFKTLLGLGYFAFPAMLMVVAIVFLTSRQRRFMGITLLGALLFILSVLGLIDIAEAGGGGWLGLILGSLKVPFGSLAASVINSIATIAAILITLNVPLKIKFPEREEEEAAPLTEKEESEIAAVEKEQEEKTSRKASESEEEEEIKVAEPKPAMFAKIKKHAPISFKNYVPPPLDLLKSSVEKPTTGDLRANANVIKRTLDSFGIPVEMGEINIGPKVTRYTLKPAEGVKLSRITALGQDLAMALAAHPIRIEAPIPGKSLVGIEVPNKAAALVRIGSLMTYPDFNSSLLGFVLGRDVTGEPIFADLEKMPHLLIAGATGSGKSIMIQSLIISLLYKNSPATLKMVMVDPKRVELSGYEGIPHLVSPVIVENKKALNVLRWAVKEMEQRYELLQKSGSRDIKSYNAKMKDRPAKEGEENAPQPLPYIVIIVDELADLMTSYGREVEGYVVRLAQMARATGIHLVLSTQRPSVEIITGLIKANITSRIALQVASQIDSRTIIDTSGAEKLLGGGDLLFVSAELSKPKRIQGAYISEDEIKKVADFIRDNNETPEEEIQFSAENGNSNGNGHDNNNMFHLFDDSLEEDGDEMYDEAVEVVRQAQKASASLLQRRLKVGYARAARLLDLMEEKGIIGPGEGAKPRDVYLGKDVFPEQ